MIKVDVPEYGTFIEFPDSTTPDEIQRVMLKNFPPKKKAEPAFVTVDGAGGVIEGGNADTLRNVVKPVPALTAAEWATGIGGTVQQLGEDPIGYINRHTPGGAIRTAIGRMTGHEAPKTAIGPNKISRWGEDLAEQGKMVRKQIEEEHPLDPTSFASDIRNAMATTYGQIPAMLAGGFAGKAIAATGKIGSKMAMTMGGSIPMAQMGLQTEGMTYHERRAAGFDIEPAAMSATFDGIVEVATEAAPNVRLLLGTSKILKLGTKKLVEQFVKYSGEEFVGEAVATLLQDLNGRYMSDPKLSHEERVKKVEEYFTSGDWKQAQVSTARTTLAQLLMMGGMAKGARTVASLAGKNVPGMEPPKRSTADVDILSGELPEDPQHAAIKSKVDELFKRHGAGSPYGDQAGVQPEEGVTPVVHNYPETAINQFAPTGSRENPSPAPQLGDQQAAIFGQEPISRDLYDWQNMPEEESVDLLDAMATGREQSVNRRYGYPQPVEAEVVPRTAINQPQLPGSMGPVYDAEWTNPNQIALNRAGVQVGQPYNPDAITPEVIPPAQAEAVQPGVYDVEATNPNQIPQHVSFGAREAISKVPDTIAPATDITPGFTKPTRTAPAQVVQAQMETSAPAVKPKPAASSELPPPELEKQGISITTGAKGKVTKMEKNGKSALRTPDNKWRVYEGGAIIDVDTQREAAEFLNREVVPEVEDKAESSASAVTHHKNKKGETISMTRGGVSAKLDKSTGQWTTFEGKERVESGLEKEEAESWINDNAGEENFAAAETATKQSEEDKFRGKKGVLNAFEANTISDLVNRMLPPGVRVDILDKVERDAGDKSIQKSLSAHGLKQKSGTVEVKGTHVTVKSRSTGEITSLIELSLNYVNKIETAIHETWHSLEDLVLTDRDKKIMYRHYTPIVGSDGTVKKTSRERCAEAAGSYLFGKLKNAPPEVHAILQKIAQFLERLGNAVKGLGYRSARDVMDEAFSGKLKDQAAARKTGKNRTLASESFSEDEGPAREKPKEAGKAAADAETSKVSLEVAPNPDDKELYAEWQAVPFKERLKISQKVAAKMLPKVMEEVGTTGTTSLVLGGYKGDTNPSMSISVENPQLSITLAKLCGFVFGQQEMMMVSSVPVHGAKEMGAIVISLPDGYGVKEVTALYDKLWEMERDGNKLVMGHTTAEGQMVILNDPSESGIDTETLADMIDKHLGTKFKVGAEVVYAAFPKMEDYNYASGKKSEDQAGSPISQRGHRLRAEATGLLREALDGRKSARSRKPAPVAADDARGAERDGRPDEHLQGYHPSKQPAGGGRIAKVLPVREDGRIVVHHYSRGARDVISTHFVGTGIEGAEKKKRERISDVYMNPVYTAIPGIYDTEEALRSVHWRHDVSIPPEKLYDWQRAKTDGLIDVAREKSKAARGGISDEAHIEWTANRMLRDAGYWGMYNSLEKGQQAIVLLWESVTPETITNVSTGETIPSKGVTSIPADPPAPKTNNKALQGETKDTFDVSVSSVVSELAQILEDKGIPHKGYKLYNNSSPEYYQENPEILGAIADMGYQSVSIAGEVIPVSSFAKSDTQGVTGEYEVVGAEDLSIASTITAIRSLPSGTIKRAAGMLLNPAKAGHTLHTMAGFFAPTQVVKFFNDNFSTPLFYAERNPEVSVIVENAWQRQSESFEIRAKFHEYTDSQGNKKTLNDLHKEYGRLGKPQRKDVDRLLVMGDALSKEYATLADARQDVPGVNQAAFDHYQEFRGFIRSIFPKAKEEILENQLEKYNNDPVLKETLRQLIQSGGGLTQAQTDAILLDAYMDLKGLRFVIPEYQKRPWFNDLANLMGYSVNAQGKVSWTKPADLKQLQANPQQFAGKISPSTLANPKQLAGLLAAYQDVVDNKRVDRAVKRAAQDVVTARKSLSDLTKTFHAIQGWMPRMREDGSHRVEVYALDANGDKDRLVYVDFRDSPHSAVKLAEKIRSNPGSYYGINIQNMPQGTVFSEPQISEDSKRLPESIYADRATDIATEQLIEAAISKLRDKYGMDSSQEEALRDAVMKAAADRVLARGAGAHKLRRAPYLIEGYATDDPYYAISRYIGGLSGFLSKGRYAIRQMQALADIQSKTHKDWAYTYIRNTLRNATKADQYGATIRALATVWFLGLRVSSAVYNATQNAMYGQAELSRYTKDPVTTFLAAYRDLGLDKAAKVKGKQTVSLTPSEQAAIQDAIKRGAIHETIVGDQIGKGEGFTNKAGRALERVVDITMMPFQFVEQYINREPAFLAAYRVFAKKNPSFKASKQQPYDPVAFKAALEFVNQVHFLPGKANLPSWAHNAFGRTAYTLMSYVANSFNWIYNRGTSGEKDQVIAVVRMMAAVSLIGGVSAIPILGDDFWKLLQGLFKVDYKAEIEKKLRESTSDIMFSDHVLDAIFHGLPSFAGVNVTNAVTMRIPLLSNMLAGDEFIESASGAVGGLAAKVWKGGKAALAGEPYRAAEYAAPEFISGAMRAGRMASEGATTSSGKTIYGPDMKQLKFSASDVVKRTLGFQPLDQSRLAAARNREFYYRDVYGAKKKKASTKARKLLRDKDVAGAIRAIAEFNAMIVESPAKELVPPFKNLRSVFADATDKRSAAYLKGQELMLGEQWQGEK